MSASLSPTTPTDQAEAQALDALADTLEILAAVCDAWAVVGCRPLARVLRDQGDGASDRARAEFIALADVFGATWPSLRAAVAAAMKAMKEE
jgi:hypothetical protein